MTTPKQPNTTGLGHAPSSTWLLRLGVLVLVAGGLSIVGMLALTQTHRQPVTTNLRFVSSSFEISNPSEKDTSLDAWRADILSPANLHAVMADLRLDHSLLPRGEKINSIEELEARIQGLLQVDAVRDRRHADNQIRITFPVGRNVSEAVALVNGLAQQTVAGREETARKAAALAEQQLLAKRASTAQASEQLQRLQSELAGLKAPSSREGVADNNSVTVDAFFAERRSRLSLDLAEYQLRRDVLLETFLPAHPEVVALDSKIETTQAALAQTPAKSPLESNPLPGGVETKPARSNEKLLADISVALADWQKVSADQAAAEREWQAVRSQPSYVLSLAQVPIVPAPGDKSSTAALSFVVLAAMAVGIAAASWVRHQPVVLKSAREIEKLLHLKVLAVLPSARVKI